MNGDVCLEQAIATINHLAIDQPRFSRELMFLDGPGSVDVKDFVAVSHQPVGNQHTVAVKIHALGTHLSRARVLGQLDQFGDAALEVLGEHVIGIVAEAVVAQCGVG